MFIRPAVFIISGIVCLLLVSLSAFPSFLLAQSASLNDAIDLVTDTAPSAVDVNHTIAFTLPASSQNMVFTDYLQITLTNFTDIDPSGLSITGEYTGTPTFYLTGPTVRITGINVLAGDRIQVDGISATNPGSFSQSNYTVLIAITEDEVGNLIKNSGLAVAQESEGTIEVSATIDNPQGRLSISGFTAPQTYVVFSEGGNIIGTDVAGGTGVFSKLFEALSPNTHSISIYGIDTNDLNTSIIPYTVNTPANQTITLSNILLSPTVSIDSNSYVQGAAVHATGSAYPGSSITVFTDTPLRTYSASASASGDWTTSITNTSDYTPGDYRLYTLTQTTGGLQSITSPTLVFTITSSSGSSGTACGDITKGDLNCDDDINLTDFSILMYYWGTDDETADINSDDIVSITDFSIMMYYWGSI